MDNLKKISVSAPGKLMLFGEHAVVYGYPCIVTAIGQRMQMTATVIAEPVFELEAPDIGITGYRKTVDQVGFGEIPECVRFVENTFRNFIDKYGIGSGVRFETFSVFSTQFGFGSSSAVTVCTAKALAELSGKKLSSEDLFRLSYRTILDVQGKASGFDVAAAVYGRTFWFLTGGKAVEPLDLVEIPLVVGYSGIKADTCTMIDQVGKKMNSYPEKIDRIFNAISGIVGQAKEAIISGDWERVGKLATFNQEYLRDLGVSTERLETMISAANAAGAYGAKLSGAGGGDCMIAITPPERRQQIASAIKSAGGTVIDVKTNVTGVEIEEDKLYKPQLPVPLNFLN